MKPHLRKYYLGNYEFLKQNKNSKYKFLIGSGRGDIRKKILNYIEKNKIILNWGIFISPNSNVMKSVKLNEGVVILKNSVINNNCIIGKHCHFNTRSIIEHDNKFDDFSGTGPGVITGSNVVLAKKLILIGLQSEKWSKNYISINNWNRICSNKKFNKERNLLWKPSTI